MSINPLLLSKIFNRKLMSSEEYSGFIIDLYFRVSILMQQFALLNQEICLSN